MKTYILIAFTVICITIGCSSKSTLPKQANNENKTIAIDDTVRIANDSLEYEVIIIDPGFNSWLISRARPRGYYSQPYFENRNRMWVMEWNNRALNPTRYGDMYQMQIDYQSRIDYGYEINYMLYNYLVYFQITNNQKLGGNVPQY